MTLPRLLLLLTLLASPLLAEAAGRPLILAFNTFPPWKTLDSRGEPAGPYVDIVRELAQRLNAPLRFLHCPIQRCLQAMEQGRADVVIGVRSSPDRAAYIDYLSPAYAPANPLVVYTRVADPRKVTRYEDLYGLVLGVVEGVKYQPRFDADARLLREPAPNIHSNFNKLLAGRVDAIIINRQHGEALVARGGWQGLLKQQPLLLDGVDERQLGLSRRSPWQTERARVCAALRAMVKDGSVNRLLGVTLRRP